MSDRFKYTRIIHEPKNFKPDFLLYRISKWFSLVGIVNELPLLTSIIEVVTHEIDGHGGGDMHLFTRGAEVSIEVLLNGDDIVIEGSYTALGDRTPYEEALINLGPLNINLPLSSCDIDLFCQENFPQLTLEEQLLIFQHFPQVISFLIDDSTT